MCLSCSVASHYESICTSNSNLRQIVMGFCYLLHTLERKPCVVYFTSKVAILPENGFIRQKERQIIVCQEVSSEHEIGEKKGFKIIE